VHPVCEAHVVTSWEELDVIDDRVQSGEFERTRNRTKRELLLDHGVRFLTANFAKSAKKDHPSGCDQFPFA
jgi:hypothetical protein